MKNNIIKIFFKSFALIILFMFFYKSFLHSLYFLADFIIPLFKNRYDSEILLNNMSYLRNIALGITILSGILSLLLIYKYGVKIITFFLLKSGKIDKSLFISFAILITIPLVFSSLRGLLAGENQLENIIFIFPVYLGGALGSMLMFLLFPFGVFGGIASSIPRLLFIKLVLVIIYVKFLNVSNKTKYIVSTVLGIISVITGHLYFGMLMSV